MADVEVIRAIRRKTTDDEDLLSNTVIDEIVTDNTSGGVYDFYGAVADCWEYIGRDDLYGSQTEGNLMYSTPLASRKSAYYRSLSPRQGGAIPTVGQMTRDDNLEDEDV